jgi:hypothetical protein
MLTPMAFGLMLDNRNAFHLSSDLFSLPFALHKKVTVHC